MSLPRSDRYEVSRIGKMRLGGESRWFVVVKAEQKFGPLEEVMVLTDDQPDLEPGDAVRLAVEKL